MMNGSKTNKKNVLSLIVRDSVKLLDSSRKKRRSQLPSKLIKEGQPLATPVPKKVTAKEEEEWNIKSLPSDWQPNLKPSKVIARLMEKKQKEHEQAVEEMETRISQVNSCMEEKIRQTTVIYKEALIQRSRDVEETMKPIRVERRGKLQFTHEYFDELINKVFDVSGYAKSKLHQMVDDLIDLEVERTYEFTTILKDACDQLNEISFLLPFELQEYFEKKIQGINEITVNNMRCYAELKTQLQLHLQNELRLQLQEIQSAKEHWIDFMNASAIQELNETKLLNVDCSQVLLESEAFKTGEKQLLERSNEIEDLHAQITRPHGIPLDAICKWLQEVDAIAFDLDSFAKELLHTFERSVADFFQMYLTDVDRLAEKITSLSCTEFSQAKADLYEPLLLRTATKYNLKIQNIQKSWSAVQEELLGHVQETFAFMYRVAELKKNHQGRLQDIETLVVKDLQKLEKQNDGRVRAEEIKLNKALDVLRQESELEDMGTSMRQIQTTLANMEKVYNSNYEKECKLLQKATDLVEKEADVLVAELQQFLSVYSEFAPTGIEGEESSTISDKEVEEEEEKGGLLSSQIEMCRSQIEKLKTWRSELYQAIEYYFFTCRQHNLEWANAFVEKQKRDLEEILTNKLTFLCKTKYDRIKATIYDLRAGELRKHRERLREHQAGIGKQMENISAIFPKYAPKYDALISAYKEDVTNLTSKIETAGNLEVVMLARASLRSLTETCKKKLEEVDQQYQKEYHSEKNRIPLANINFIKALVLFTDGGNFSPQEAKSTCKELAKLEKTAKKKVPPPVKASKSKFEKCYQEVQAKYEELQTLASHHTEELEFSNKYKTTFKELQAALIQETFDLKFKLNQLAAFVGNAKQIQEKYLGVSNCAKFVLDLFSSTREKFLEYLSVILRPQARNYGNYVAKELLKTDSKEVSSDCKGLLFDVKPEVGANYISKTQDFVYTSYERVHTFGADLYSRYTNSGFHRKELLHPTFEDYIIEMLPKHVHFYLQCEMAWLKETHEFIEMAEDLSCYFLEYCSRFLRQHADNCMRDLQRDFGDVCTKVEGQARRNQDEFFKIHRKLKPLHGYPGNKSMLEDLDLEMEEFFQCKTEESQPFFHEIITDLENKMELFKAKITELDGELKVAKQIFFDTPLSKAILVQYEATVTYLKPLLALKYVADAENVGLKMRILQELDSLKKENLSLPFDYVPKVECVVEDKIDNDGTSSSVSSSNEELNCLIQKYEEEMQAFFAELNQMEENDKEILQQWKDMWALDKIKIAQLYDVKYNLPS